MTLKLVARFGDACNIGGAPDNIRRKLEILKGHCDSIGRGYGTIVKRSNLVVHVIGAGEDPAEATARARGHRSYEDYAQQTIVGTADQIAARVQAVVDAGIEYVITYIPGVAYDRTPMERFNEEVIPRFG